MLARDRQRAERRRKATRLAAVVGLSAMAAAAIWQGIDETGDDASIRAGASADPDVVEALQAAAAAVAPFTATSPCPNRQLFYEAQGKSDGDFAFESLPADGSAAVMQMTIGDTEESDGQGPSLVVTICRAPDGSDWYFSRGIAHPTVGLVAPAERNDGGYGVDFTFDSGGEIHFDVTGDGVEILEVGRAAVQRDMADAICTEDDVPVSFDGERPPPCSADTLLPWEP